MENQERILDDKLYVISNGIDEQKIISLNKFIFLSIISFGAYDVWWIYKAWRFFKQKDKLDIMPAARAFFSIFFILPLFDKIRSFAIEKGYSSDYSSAALFFGSILGYLLSRLPDPFWLFSILSVVFLIPPFKALNYAKQNSKDFIVSDQTRFSGRQVGLIVLGTIFWGLVLLSLTMEDALQ